MPSRRLLIVAVTLLLGSCGRDDDSKSSADLFGSLPGVYNGTFPCRNCPGIRTTLWLRSDGRFFIRRRYPEGPDSDEVTTYNLGRWSWMADISALELRGAGPIRTFRHPHRNTLIMRTESDLEYRLSREPTTSNFTSTIAMSGLMSMTGGSASFAECLTGLAAPVDKVGDFERFQRQYRSVGAQGKPVYVEFEGGFSWAADGSLQAFTIERFITIKEGRAC
jgi:hypothetical protein